MNHGGHAMLVVCPLDIKNTFNMPSDNIFKGFQVIARKDKPEKDSDNWKQLTWAINMWRSASTQSGQSMDTCRNAARELEIERDHGVVVVINKRTVPKHGFL